MTMAAGIADVIEMPARRIAGVANLASDAVSGATNAATGVAGRLVGAGNGSVDDWGRDPTFVGIVNELSQLRWDIATGGSELLPAGRGALIVTNAQRFASTPLLTAMALTRAVDRPVRFVGRPDTAPVGPLLRRLGGLLARPEEVEGALRDGDLVVMGAAPTLGPRRVGTVDHRLVGAAVVTKVAVFPAATSSTPFGRQVRIELGHRVAVPRKRRGPLAELELADAVQREIALVLDEMGDIATGTPLDWLPFSRMGSH
jgi:hypothetical protein